MSVGDHIFEYLDGLRQVGFSAFDPFVDFVESFAVGDDEIVLHRKLCIELAKYYLTNVPHASTEAEREQLYVSPLAQRLLEEQDIQAGRRPRRIYQHVPGDEPVWIPGLDPCIRRMKDFERRSREDYERQRTAMRVSMRSRLLAEVPRHATGLSRGYAMWSPGPRSRLNFFDAVMARDAAVLGFHYDKRKSRVRSLVYSKPITQEWDLCMELEENMGMFFFSAREGHFVLDITVRGRSLRGQPRESGEMLQINYGPSIPGFGAGGAYWKFESLDELETIVRAHLHVHSLMAPVIEAALHAVL
jgi:hypothetical protein